MKRLLALGVVVTLMSAGPLVAQNDGTELIGDARARDSIRQIMRAVQSKGVPVEPLVTKIREGIAKRSEPARIQAAVQLLADRLVLSFAALSPTLSHEELSAGAGALQVGVPAPTLRDLRRLWPSRALTVPLGVLTELVAQGVPAARAITRVRELMQRGASNAQLVAMGSDFQADVASGITPDASLELRSKGVLSLLTTSPIGTTLNPASPPIRPP